MCHYKFLRELQLNTKAQQKQNLLELMIHCHRSFGLYFAEGQVYTVEKNEINQDNMGRMKLKKMVWDQILKGPNIVENDIFYKG